MGSHASKWDSDNIAVFNTDLQMKFPFEIRVIIDWILSNNGDILANV